MNILQIITFILCGIIGYIVMKFIYKNFIKPLEREEPEKSAEVSPFEFIKNDKLSEGIDIEFIEKAIENYQCGHSSLYTNEGLLQLVVDQWGAKLKKEAFEQNVIDTGRYMKNNGSIDIDFHNVTSIMNVGQAVCSEETIIVCGQSMCRANLIRELPELFHQWKMKQQEIIK